MSMFWKPASSLPATSAGSHAPDQAKPVAQRGASLQAWWTCARTWRHLWHTVQRLRLRQRMWLEGANSPRPHPLPAAKNYTSNKKNCTFACYMLQRTAGLWTHGLKDSEAVCLPSPSHKHLQGVPTSQSMEREGVHEDMEQLLLATLPVLEVELLQKLAHAAAQLSWSLVGLCHWEILSIESMSFSAI